MGFSTKVNEKEVICTYAMDGLQTQEKYLIWLYSAGL